MEEQKSTIERYVDLHTHPLGDHVIPTRENVESRVNAFIDSAIKEGLSSIAVTEHNKVSSMEYALKRGKEKGIEVIPGIELCNTSRNH